MGGLFSAPKIPTSQQAPATPEEVVDENRIKMDEEARLASKRGRRMNVLVGDYLRKNNMLGSSTRLGD